MEQEYNGHPSHAHWNVALWIGNDEGLYHAALDAIDLAPDCNDGTMLDHAYNIFRESTGMEETPDGVTLCPALFKYAVRGLFDSTAEIQ